MSSRRRSAENNPFKNPSVASNGVADGFLQTLVPADMDQVGYGGAALPVIRESDGTVHLGNFTLTPTGLVIEREVTEVEWRAFYTGIQRTRRALQWIIGDWMLYGMDKGWTPTYEDVAKLTGLADKTVKEYTYICRNIPASIRMDKLSFGHHQVVAAVEDSVKQGWLHYALKEKLSIRQLREAIAKRIREVQGLPDEEIPQPPPLLDQANKKRFSKIWRNLERGTEDKIKRDEIRLMRAWLDEVEKKLNAKK